MSEIIGVRLHAQRQLVVEFLQRSGQPRQVLGAQLPPLPLLLYAHLQPLESHETPWYRGAHAASMRCLPYRLNLPRCRCSAETKRPPAPTVSPLPRPPADALPRTPPASWNRTAHVYTRCT